MPICTSCTHPTPYLYTVYNTANNLRLEQCVSLAFPKTIISKLNNRSSQSACHAFADPYVEHDTLTLLLDLILLKRDVFRHLLFNRGTGIRYLGPQSSTSASPGDANSTDTEKLAAERERRRARWRHIFRLGVVLIVVDACTSSSSVLMIICTYS